MNQECCPSCNSDMELAELFCRNCGWRRPAEVDEKLERRSRLPIILISVCAVLGVMLIGCHFLLKNITSPERSMELLRAALQSGDEDLFLNLISADGNEEQAAALFHALQDIGDTLILSDIVDAVEGVHQSGLHQIIRGNVEEPLLRLYLESRFGLYPVVKFAIAPGFGEVEIKDEVNETASVMTMDAVKDQPLSTEEAQKVVEDLLDSISEVFRKHGEQFEVTSDMEADDYFGMIRPSLLDYASIEFTDGYLKGNASLFYFDYDVKVFPSTSLDVRFTLHEVAADRFIASSIEFGDGIVSYSATLYYTVVKEDGYWKMDEFKWVPSTEEHINVTADEVLAHMKTYNPGVEIVKEVEYNGSKVYIISFGEGEMYYGLYADTADIGYDIPDYLYPKGPVNPSLPTLPLTRDQAEIAVKEYLRIGEYDVTKVAYDHDNERGHYVILVYEIMDAGTQYERLATIGWYGVDPQTGRVYDAMFGE
ncbi:hypothetical protein [Sporosarcina sp. Marseille-Q4943]|uniref:hypothetical protein n=1 Tax=Sporosarcina sp. Marseille-Q4943 TaxID=2942204 RepID=UPI00208DC5E4|nr:hypothetical protein [Sporosarcina sp. Marseille-Q4943]